MDHSVRQAVTGIRAAFSDGEWLTTGQQTSPIDDEIRHLDLAHAAPRRLMNLEPGFTIERLHYSRAPRGRCCRPRYAEGLHPAGAPHGR